MVRPSSLICLNGRFSSFSSKSYQYLPRTKARVSPRLSSRSCTPLKIFEKVSPFLKFRRPSSPEEEKPLPPLVVSIRWESGSDVAQLAPTDSEESNWPWMSPTLKATANAGCWMDAETAAASRQRLKELIRTGLSLLWLCHVSGGEHPPQWAGCAGQPWPCRKQSTALRSSALRRPPNAMVVSGNIRAGEVSQVSRRSGVQLSLAPASAGE
ncbi:hypothetical protein D3C84_483690 [compost metagenome]